MRTPKTLRTKKVFGVLIVFGVLSVLVSLMQIGYAVRLTKLNQNYYANDCRSSF